LRKRVPAGFTVVEERPFVVLGDEEPEVVADHARSTVRWTVRMLKQDYFARDPEPTIDIWLLRDDESYRRHARRLFGFAPRTPYGYYDPQHHALLMNIATGGGTLVHEIVHPFMAANFPACPTWLNEGLGSLYERCAEKDGRIVGLTNWRLPGLQRAVREGTVPPFEKLAGMGSEEFRHGPGHGVNYAAARYLCQYLQERGVLVRFYKAFVAAHDSDPTGYSTLQDVLDVDDMADFRRRWEDWILGLSYVPP
jgi:hypothetical protein